MNYQQGITALGTSDHVYLELDFLTPPAEALAALVDTCNFPTTAGVNVVIGVRPSLWNELADAEDKATDVHDFDAPLRGAEGYSMPATQHDAWVWVAAGSRSQVFDATKIIAREIKEHAKIVRETNGWVYESNRDLTGFEDGTENPGLFEAPSLVAQENGASILLFQHWLHQAQQWEDLSVEKQEGVIGRTKLDSVELDDEVKPDSSHVSRTVVERDGEELEVFRRNTSYGDMGRHGTVFVGFTFDQWRMEEMLRRMAGADGGPRDALTHFTTATSGSWYVCPSVEALAKFLPED